jgi:malate permease and related proteins
MPCPALPFARTYAPMLGYVVDTHAAGIVAAMDWSQMTQLAGWSILPLVRLGVLVSLGAFLFRRGVMTKPIVEGLSRLTVALLLPCFTATSILAQFRPGEAFYQGWYFLPISAMLMIGLFALLAWPVARLGRAWLAPRYTVATLSFHNAGYLAIPIVTELYGHGRLARHQGAMQALLFLFIMGISPLMWSLGVMAFRGAASGKAESTWRKALSPPFVACVASVLLCLLRIPQQIPSETLTLILSPFVMLGASTVPLMMLILGATLMQLDHSYRPPLGLSIAALALRLVIFPGIILGVLSLLLRTGAIDPAKAIILFIESAMPTAVAMTVIAHRYASERTAQAASGLIFLQYLLAAATLPLWLTIWGLLYGYEVG